MVYLFVFFLLSRLSSKRKACLETILLVSFRCARLINNIFILTLFYFPLMSWAHNLHVLSHTIRYMCVLVCIFSVLNNYCRVIFYTCFGHMFFHIFLFFLACLGIPLFSSHDLQSFIFTCACISNYGKKVVFNWK